LIPQGTVGHVLSSPYCTRIGALSTRPAIVGLLDVSYARHPALACSRMRRTGDRNRCRAQPVEHGLQINEPMGCSKVQRCERTHHLQSEMSSYSHPSRSSINKRMLGVRRRAISLRAHRVEMFRAESTGRFRLTTSNHAGGCEIHARTIAGVFA